MDAPAIASDTPSSLIEATHSLFSLMAGDQEAARFFATLHIDIYLCVLDTNHLLSDIKYRIASGHTTGLLEAAWAGSLRLVASPQVGEEVAKHLGEYVRKYSIDPREALQVWEKEYRPHITFVDPADVPALSTEVVRLAQRDPTDVPTAQLIELLQSDTAFSRDRDLAAFDTIAHDTARIAVAYRTIARRDATVVAVHVSGSVVITLTTETVKAAVTAARSLVERMDKRLLVGILIGAGLIFLAIWALPSSRRWVGDHAKQLFSVAGRGLDAYASMETNARQVRKTLAEVRRPVTVVRRTAREYVALVLGRAPGPLTVRTIAMEMQRAGYRPRSAHPERHVAHVLRQNARLFERAGTRRWRLRHQPIRLQDRALGTPIAPGPL